MKPERTSPESVGWAELAASRWRRVRWREGLGPQGATCAAFGTPLHRVGTYYRRPVYTDGERWLSQQAYDEMVRRTGGLRASRRSSARPPGPPDSPAG